VGFVRCIPLLGGRSHTWHYRSFPCRLCRSPRIGTRSS
jgi:hypothetical protein